MNNHLVGPPTCLAHLCATRIVLSNLFTLAHLCATIIVLTYLFTLAHACKPRCRSTTQGAALRGWKGRWRSSAHALRRKWCVGRSVARCVGLFTERYGRVRTRLLRRRWCVGRSVARCVALFPERLGRVRTRLCVGAGAGVCGERCRHGRCASSAVERLPERGVGTARICVSMLA